MRSLFLSEERILDQMIRNETGSVPDLRGVLVVRETHSKSRGNPAFNCGFFLEFGRRIANANETRCITRSILPQAIGLEMFLVIDKNSHLPISLELLTGEGLRMRDFRDPHLYLDEFLNRLSGSTDALGGLAIPRSIAEFGYTRLVWMYEEIAFLLFSECYSASGDVDAQCLHNKADDHAISVVTRGKQCCVDGWVKHRNWKDRSRAVAVFSPKSGSGPSYPASRRNLPDER